MTKKKLIENLILFAIVGFAIGVGSKVVDTVDRETYNRKMIQRDLLKDKIDECDKYNKELKDIVDKAKNRRKEIQNEVKQT